MDGFSIISRNTHDPFTTTQFDTFVDVSVDLSRYRRSHLLSILFSGYPRQLQLHLGRSPGVQAFD